MVIRQRMNTLSGDSGPGSGAVLTDLAVDPNPIVDRLREEFEARFGGLPLTMDTWARLITEGALLVIEEVAKQGQDAGNGAVMIAAPQKPCEKCAAREAADEADVLA